jgi:hypothetical protein
LQLDLILLVAQEKGTGLCEQYDPDKSTDARAKKLADISDKLREIVGISGSAGSLPAGTSQSAGQASPAH